MKRMSLVFSLILMVVTAPTFAGLPDTGQTKCYDNESEIPCPQPGEPFYGQDAQYGPNLQSFTDLGNGIVRDNITGLEWQQATAPGTYTWQQALDYCEGLSLGGHDDWRLPTIKELSTLVDCSIPAPGPTINTTYFPDTQPKTFWSSTTHAIVPVFAWVVEFVNGYVGYGLKTNVWYVRGVRAGQSGLFDNSFIDNHDGTVTDTSTGLMWQQATAPGTYTWQQSLAYCEGLTLAGHDDWRLPNRNELQSLLDYSRYNPAIDTSFFPEPQPSPYWSSTTLAHQTDYAWHIDSIEGFVNYSYYKNNYNYIRAVRGGQGGPPPPGDSDNDGIRDDGDNSSIVGDNPCTGGQTQDCDDNCRYTPNQTQADADSDAVGDACDICWTKSNPTQLDTNGNCPAPPYTTDPQCGDACNVCMADYDNNGKTNLTDLGILKGEFGRTNCKTVPPACRADTNADGKVNLTDLGKLKGEFGKTNCFQ